MEDFAGFLFKLFMFYLFLPILIIGILIVSIGAWTGGAVILSTVLAFIFYLVATFIIAKLSESALMWGSFIETIIVGIILLFIWDAETYKLIEGLIHTFD